MLAEPKLKTLLDLINSSSRDELIWINGYVSGLVAQHQPAGQVQPAASPAPVAAATAAKITIAYGTETGNSKKLAAGFAAKAKQQGIAAKLVSMDQYRLNDLSREEYFLAIISTQGEGEPPAAAKKFYDHIHNNGFKLPNLKYSVLALGDTSYPLFCKAGEDVDEQLRKLGGNSFVPIRKCDLEYEEEANNWFSAVLKALAAPATATAPAGTTAVTPAPAKKAAGKKNYTGTVLAITDLNDRGSEKATWHIEIAAEGLEYEPGDSIGIVPASPLKMVEAILSVTGTDRDKSFAYRNVSYTAFDLLRTKLNIVHLSEKVVKRYAAIIAQDIPDTKIDLLDLLKIYPVKDEAQLAEVFNILNPASPRLYTIASAPAAHEGEVHITVARDAFEVNGEQKFGLCSQFLGNLKEGDSIDFFIQKNKRFKLPAAEKDVIMVGPGTGIAAFRSFLAERDANGATGRNWLFFGEQHFTSDFLYQSEIQNWADTGVLTKVNVAFSRDQEHKVYVQHRMQQHAGELFHWLEAGAHLYICGSKDPMAGDVEKTLLEIIAGKGNKTAEEAALYLEAMEENGRYHKDVY